MCLFTNVCTTDTPSPCSIVNTDYTSATHHHTCTTTTTITAICGHQGIIDILLRSS